jgi:hypothetical protein
MTALSIPAAGLPKTAGVVAISPLTDDSLDRAVCGGGVRPLPRTSAFEDHGGCAGSLASPVAIDLHDMPPVMIHAGADELLVGDAELMTNRLRHPACRPSRSRRLKVLANRCFSALSQCSPSRDSRRHGPILSVFVPKMDRGARRGTHARVCSLITYERNGRLVWESRNH